MINICFMGNPKFALQTLDILYNDENIDVKLVVTGKDKKRSRNKFSPTPVKKSALDKGLRVDTPDTVNSEDFIGLLKDLEIDFIVVVAFGELIKSDLLKAYEDKIINLHPSLLPKYRGASPMQFALLNGDEKTAASAMLIEAGMDSGDILVQEDFDIKDDYDYFDLEESLGELGAKAIRKAILNYDELFDKRTIQDDDKATYTTKISKSMGKIDWNEKTRDILNKVRAFVAYPVAFFTYKGANVKVHKASLIEGYKGEPGEILKADKELIIATADGALRIDKIQYPGKKAMDTQSFLLGNSLEKGYVLENE